jgi:glycosyltransferase involved in cell wall biosynthesis
MSLVKIICVNDGSTDSTLSILQEYEKKLGDEKFILIDQKNQGIFNTRRTLLSNLSTNWCIFLDSDD